MAVLKWRPTERRLPLYPRGPVEATRLNRVVFTVRDIIYEIGADLDDVVEDFFERHQSLWHLPFLTIDTLRKIISMEIDRFISLGLTSGPTQHLGREVLFKSREQLQGEEILESLELEGIQTERLPAYMHPSGYNSWRFISTPEITESGFSQYTVQNIAMLSKRDQVHSFRAAGRVFLDGIGIMQLMSHEQMSLDGKLSSRGMRIGEYRGGGPNSSGRPKPPPRPPLAS
jgi:hypothetical protein